jgi:hypothetical protein
VPAFPPADRAAPVAPPATERGNRIGAAVGHRWPPAVDVRPLVETDPARVWPIIEQVVTVPWAFEHPTLGRVGRHVMHQGF